MNYQLTLDAFIGPWAYSKQYVRNVLSGYADKHVDAKISSLGGNLDHGLDIRQQFIDHGDVTVYLSGFVASAATVIAMGAKKIVMSRYAMFLVHKCSNFIDAWGSYNADQMQQLIDELEANKKENDKIDVVLANMYAAKCKKKFNALGISTLGLENVITPVYDQRLDGPVTVTFTCDASNSSIKIPHMKTYKFSTVESLLKLDAITPDNDGYVSITADQFEAVNNRLESLEKDATNNAAAIAAKDDEIKKLTEQIENLKKAPGAETSDIVDSSSSKEEEQGCNAHDLFNLVKSVI